MIAGKLRHRISFFQRNKNPDGCGGFIETYTIKGICWASIEPQSPVGNEEQFRDRKITEVKSHKIKIRQNVGFTPQIEGIIIFKDRLFRVNGISDTEERDFQYSIFCYEIQNDEVDFGQLFGLFNFEGEPVYNDEGDIVYNMEGVA